MFGVLRRLTAPVQGLADAGFVIVLGMTVACWMARVHWTLDIFTHFRVHFVVCLMAYILLSMIRRAPYRSTAAAFLLGLHAAVVIPLYVHSDTPESSAITLRVASINVHANNMERDAVVTWIRDSDSDMVLLMETTARWGPHLRDLEDAYPHQLFEPRGDAFGIALLSRLPLMDQGIFYIEGAEVPSVRATVKSVMGPIRFYGTHPVPPISPKYAKWRNAQMDALEPELASVKLPLVVAGDLNCTPWSPHFRDFLRNGRLKDGRKGFGILPTFATNHPIIQIPIDHILVSPELGVSSFEVGTDLGSDHLPVIADIVISAD